MAALEPLRSFGFKRLNHHVIHLYFQLFQQIAALLVSCHLPDIGGCLQDDRFSWERKTQLFILQGLPGVGPERAGRLRDSFGSVEAAISASSSELQSVDGIGKSIADRIKWAVSEQVSPYFTRPLGPGHSSAEAVTLEKKIFKSNYKRGL